METTFILVFPMFQSHYKVVPKELRSTQTLSQNFVHLRLLRIDIQTIRIQMLPAGISYSKVVSLNIKKYIN